MITLSYGKSITDNHPVRVELPDFAALARRLELPKNRAKDKKTAGYICGRFNGDGRRCAEGVEPRRWLPLDLDQIAAERLPDARMWMTRFSGVGWSTHSSTPEAPRERVLIELDRDADREECIAIGRVLTADMH
jgi:hypothetical protein